MYKKLLISIVLLVATIFSFTVCLANDGMQDAVDGVRNVVGGAENAVEGAVKDFSNTTKNVTGSMENGANNIGNDMKNSGDNNNTAKDTNNRSTSMSATNDYTATRTATDSTFMGMNATAWTWLILGIAAIAIIALVWYYSMQVRSSNYDERD